MKRNAGKSTCCAKCARMKEGCFPCVPCIEKSAHCGGYVYPDVPCRACGRFQPVGKRAKRKEA